MEQHDCCHCSQRKKERSPEEYKRLIHRLNRIEGQIRGIRGMVEAGAYCPDILVQAAAVNAAINAFHKKKDEAPAPEEPAGPTTEELLTEIRDLLKEQK